jgi:hypothetical protein
MTELYRRFDGHDELKPLFEGSDEDALVALAGKPALVRIPAAVTAINPRARLLACLMHGNEDSGYRAVLRVLRAGERFPFDLWVFIGNVRAATHQGWYAHRYLDHQEDFNRVWGLGPPTTRMRRCAAAVLDELRQADLEAAIDLHNNSGHNPYYAILPRRSDQGVQLAALCADTLLQWRLRAYTLMEALSERCPTVAVECGLPHLRESTVFASGVVRRFLAAEGFAVASGRPPTRPHCVVTMRHRVVVRPEVSFAFGGLLNDETDLVIVPGLDGCNFGMLLAGQTIGQIAPGAAIPLCATDMDGREETQRFFSTTPDGRLIVTEDLTPVMMTTTVVQARRDCLFYIARRQS